MRILTLDTETTGLVPGGIVEIAGVLRDDNMYRDGALVGLDWRGFDTAILDPGCPIDIEAIATHHITEEMVRGRPTIHAYMSAHEAMHASLDYCAAHNAPFDRSFVPAEYLAVPWIDTCQCARHVWPDAPGFSNQVLRYWLGLDVSDMPREAGELVHRALFDAWVTDKLLTKLLEHHDAERLATLSSAPALLKIVPFGKAKGQLFESLARTDSGYLRWMRDNVRDDVNIQHTARHWLSR